MICSHAQVDSMVADTVNEFGQLDIVINNAGIIRNRTFLNINEYELNRLSMCTSRLFLRQSFLRMNT